MPFSYCRSVPWLEACGGTMNEVKVVFSVGMVASSTLPLLLPFLNVDIRLLTSDLRLLTLCLLSCGRDRGNHGGRSTRFFKCGGGDMVEREGPTLEGCNLCHAKLRRQFAFHIIVTLGRSQAERSTPNHNKLYDTNSQLCIDRPSPHSIVHSMEPREQQFTPLTAFHHRCFDSEL